MPPRFRLGGSRRRCSRRCPTPSPWTNARRFGDVHVVPARLAKTPRPSIAFARTVARPQFAQRADRPTVAALIAVNRLVDPKRSELAAFITGCRAPPCLSCWTFPVARIDAQSCSIAASALVEPHKRADRKPSGPTRTRTFFIFANDHPALRFNQYLFRGPPGRQSQSSTRLLAAIIDPIASSCASALVVNREGFPLGYESLAGKTRDAATLWPMLGTLEAAFRRRLSHCLL